MRPVANQPAKLFATAKTQKFNNIEDINVDELKFRPITDQKETFTYNCSKVIAEYLKPLCKNEYCIKDTECFSEMLRDLPPLNNGEEYVSYDVDSLFTNISGVSCFALGHFSSISSKNKNLTPMYS